jgi:hypothetical protein
VALVADAILVRLVWSGPSMIANEKIIEITESGYCVLKAHLPESAIDACKEAFWPILQEYLASHELGPRF